MILPPFESGNAEWFFQPGLFKVAVGLIATVMLIYSMKVSRID
jgi:hypothetical protein